MTRMWMMRTAACVAAGAFLATGCGGGGAPEWKPIPLLIEYVKGQGGGNSGKDDGGVVLPGQPDPDTHPLFGARLGSEIPAYAAGSYRDQTGYNLVNDYDGDGIPNDVENAFGTNPFVTDHPRVTVRTDDITMAIEYGLSGETKVFDERISSANTTRTKSRNMDTVHYTKLNQKTTPYVLKTSSTDAASNANSYGYSKSQEIGMENAFSFAIVSSYSMGGKFGMNNKSSKSENWSFANSYNRSSMCEKTVFEDVNYRDNMDSEGMELQDKTAEEFSNNYRTHEISSETIVLGPNAGRVQASIYFKNESVNMPVKISKVYCSLFFKLPSGRLEAVVPTFQLKDRDGYPFEIEVGGGEETVAYGLVVDGISSSKMKEALKNGYIPLIGIVSYDITLPRDSSYQPGVTNLKQVEEGAKGRTAVIKIVSPNRRELFRVSAFDVTPDGNFTPGVSLKKALFNIYRMPFEKGGDAWEVDNAGNQLSVKTSGLWWHGSYAPPPGSDPREYAYSQGVKGNEWSRFSTEVKSYTDEYNRLRKIETIKRIGTDKKFNPFCTEDNEGYSEDRPLATDMLEQTQYWVILHNGKYFQGDLNDPVWPGDRYEIILFKIGDFREHFTHFAYTPFQSGELIPLDTRWNDKVNFNDEMARSVKMGKARKGDVIRLDVYLKESRFLFDPVAYALQSSHLSLRDQGSQSLYNEYLFGQSDELINVAGGGIACPLNPESVDAPRAWWDFRYTLDFPDQEEDGIPGNFSHFAEGGVNSIKVTINESKNARYYALNIREAGSGDPGRTVRIGADEIKKAGGCVYINSRSRLMNGAGEMGPINGGLYNVSVTAWGVYDGMQFSYASSADGTDDAKTEVSDATSTPPTNGFSYSAMNLERSKIYVRIEDTPNTEYFLIRCEGPVNSTYNGLSGVNRVREVRGHGGINVIDLEHPYGGLEEAPKEGSYYVTVYAVNRNCPAEATEACRSYKGTATVNVEYEQYGMQRSMAPFRFVPEGDRALYPGSLSRNFGLDSIDLEVNFNEGSGWWRIKLAHDDRRQGKEIDCRWTSFVQDNRLQHFVVYFKPPDGTVNGGGTVFHGSQEEVSVYLRTVPERKYRDTFWMKKVGCPSSFTEGMNGIVTDSGVKDFVQYWSSLKETDASRFETALEQYRVSSFDSIRSSLGSRPFALYDGGSCEAPRALYFFSPLEQRRYLVSGIIDESSNFRPTLPAVLDFPSFNASPGPNGIDISSITSHYATHYKLYWRTMHRSFEFSSSNDRWKEIGWDRGNNRPQDAGYWNMVEVYPDNDGKCNYHLVCNPYEKYIIALIGVSTGIENGGNGSSGESLARFTFDRNDSCDNIMYLVPYSGIPASTGPQVECSVSGRSVTVKVSPIEGQCRYVIEWKSSKDQEWSRYDTYDGSAGSLALGPVSYTIPDLSPITAYSVRVYAMTVNNLKGVVTEKAVETDYDGTIGWTAYFNNDVTLHYIQGNATYGVGSTLVCNMKELPDGTERYRITGTLTYNTVIGWLWPWITILTGTRSFDLDRSASDTEDIQMLRIEDMRAWWLGLQTIDTDNCLLSMEITAYNSGGEIICRKKYRQVLGRP